MNKLGLMATIFVASASLASSSFAAVNVALILDGASFYSASSSGYNEVQQSGLTAVLPETAMQDNLLTSTPAGWLSNGDTRYFFSQLDGNQSVIIDLGKDYSLTSFGATWVTYDRAAAGLTVYAGTMPSSLTLVGSTLLSGSNTIADSTTAQYVEYVFGAASQQYAGTPPFGGSGIEQVYASAAVPELSTWAMMLLGFGALGFACYRRNEGAALAA